MVFSAGRLGRPLGPSSVRRFSRNFGHQAALRAGLAHSSGDCVISMDADLQHPVTLLEEMIQRWRSGYAIVNTIRRDPLSLPYFKRLTSRTFYRILNFLSDAQ